MKNFFFTLLFLTPALINAQDSNYCYNSGLITTSADESAETKSFSSFSQQNSLILMPGVMNEKDVVLILKEKGNNEINKLLKKIKLSKTFKNIGFAAIPEALLGAGFIGSVSVQGNTNTKPQKVVGAGLIAISAVCLSSGLYFNMAQKKNYKKAIQKYNQMYN